MTVEFKLILGLPGSGKTHLAQELHKQALAEGRTVLLLDDPRGLPLLTAFIDKVAQVRPDLVLIADPWLCRADAQALLEELITSKVNQATITWMALSNEPEQCYRNVEARNDGRAVSADILAFSRQYVAPLNAQVLAAWRPSKT